MNKLSAFIEKRIAPIASKIARQKYIQAIQNTFLTLIPFMTIGSFALIIISPAMDYTTMDPGIMRSFFSGWQTLADFTSLPLGAVFTLTMGALSLYTSIGIGYFLSKHYKMNSYVPVAIGVCGFLIMAAIMPDGSFGTTYFDGTGLFTSILITILVIEAYRFLIDHKVGRIEIKGGGVPPALTESFGSLVPTAIILVITGSISAIVIHFTGQPFPELLTIIMQPIVGVIDSVWGVLILAILVMVLWWFGIHDTVITGPLNAFFYHNLAANSTAYLAGTAAIALPYIVTEPFWFTFMAIGGSGATFGLAILCAFSKSKQIKTVGRLGLVPAFFNINEPIIFGLPLMFNPIMFFPFVVTMALNGVVTYILMDLEIIARTFANPSWNMFAPIGALISTMDIKALILIIVLIIVDVLIYLPFFKTYEKQKIKEEQMELEAKEV